jgi:hypothetical protein
MRRLEKEAATCNDGKLVVCVDIAQDEGEEDVRQSPSAPIDDEEFIMMIYCRHFPFN